MEQPHFADRLLQEADARRSQVVVGLDPRLDLMPLSVIGKPSDAERRTPEAAAEAIVRFNEGVLDAVADCAVAVKCQIAFYERFGCPGLDAYARTLAAARERGLIVIGDVKRNDIGSTAEAYAEAHLPGEDESAWKPSPQFHADAVTVNPLLGSDGMAPFLKRAGSSGTGLFALVKTSNPSSGEIQDLPSPERPLYEHVAALVEQWGAPYCGDSGYSLLGAVVGATFPDELRRCRELMPHTLFLVPGFGAQGAGVEDVAAAFDADGRGAVVNSSRGIIYAFRREPYAEKFGAERWQEAVGAAAAEMREALWHATHGG